MFQIGEFEKCKTGELEVRKLLIISDSGELLKTMP